MIATIRVQVDPLGWMQELSRFRVFCRLFVPSEMGFFSEIDSATPEADAALKTPPKLSTPHSPNPVFSHFLQNRTDLVALNYPRKVVSIEESFRLPGAAYGLSTTLIFYEKSRLLKQWSNSVAWFSTILASWTCIFCFKHLFFFFSKTTLR